ASGASSLLAERSAAFPRKPAATSGSVVAIANFKKVAACSVRYFLPGTIWFPVTTRYYQPLPMRLRTAAESVPGEQYKSELKGGLCPGGHATACGVSLRREASRFPCG